MKTTKLTANLIPPPPPKLVSWMSSLFTKRAHRICNMSNHSQELVRQAVGFKILQHRRVVRLEVLKAVMKIEALLPCVLCHHTTSS